jgi:hypothetical protein
VRRVCCTPTTAGRQQAIQPYLEERDRDIGIGPIEASCLYGDHRRLLFADLRLWLSSIAEFPMAPIAPGPTSR